MNKALITQIIAEQLTIRFNHQVTIGNIFYFRIIQFKNKNVFKLYNP